MSAQISLFDRESDYLESDISNYDKENAQIRIHASLVYKLGESLIADEVTALSELIKNTYDADASVCVLAIDTEHVETESGTIEKGTIEIADNGCGMDLNTIVNGWLTISNSPKKKMKKEKIRTKKYSRYPLGDKGLGRLAVQKLGRYMTLITKTEDSKTEYTVTIPWGDFLKNTTIDQIPVRIKETIVDNAKSYTRIVIKDLINNEQWASKEQIGVLSNSISKIVSPFRIEDSSFTVTARVNGQEVDTSESVFAEILSTARAKHTIRYSSGIAELTQEYKKTFFYNRGNLPEIVSGKFSLNETAINDFLQMNKKKFPTTERSYSDGNIYIARDICRFPDIEVASSQGSRSVVSDPGDFMCEIYEYYLDPPYIDYLYKIRYVDLAIVRLDEYRELINRLFGVKVVRDGFIVQGYGEGEGGDWLGLSSSSKTTGSYFDLRNESVIGCVYLTGSQNAALKETTNREGFVKDEYYRTFEMILNDAVRRINLNRNKLTRAMTDYFKGSIPSSNIDDLDYTSTIVKLRQELDSTNAEVTEGQKNVAKAVGTYDTARKAMASTISNTPEIKENLDNIFQSINEVSKSYSLLLLDREKLSKRLDAISNDFEKISERLQDLFELAGLGLSVEMFSHEFDASIRNIKSRNQRFIDTGASTNIDALMKHVHYVSYSLEALRKQMSYFNPGLKYVRAEKHTFAISDFLKSHRSVYEDRCKSKGIDFQLEVAIDFHVRINRGMLYQVFDNLFNNAEYWLSFSSKNGLIDKSVYRINVPERGIIVIWDSGIGISKDIEKRLFEPFESKKPSGRGLGLYIAASNLRYNSARIRLLGERNNQDNLFKFEIDLSQITL